MNFLKEPFKIFFYFKDLKLVLTFLFITHIYSYTTYIGIYDDRQELISTQNDLIIRDTIFQSFHNSKSEVGGSVYVNNGLFSIEFSSLGFADCTTSNANCGGFYIEGHAISISHVCGYFCEAINGSNQLFDALCGVTTSENHINYMTVSFCGMKNRGMSAFTIDGSSKFVLENINSSYNMNKYGSSAYGACFRTNNVNQFDISYFNFLHSTGFDVCNTHYNPTGNFIFGNFHNCSTTHVFKYRGKNEISHSFFSLINRDSLFFVTGSQKGTSSLALRNCHFDVKPSATDYDTDVTFDSSNNEENPFNTFQIGGQEKLDKCHIPTEFFTQSFEFSNSEFFSPSKVFSKSNEFTQTDHFSASEIFTMTGKFSPSTQFTESESFLPSSLFTESKQFSSFLFFTRSITFSPTKRFTLSNIFSKSSEFTFSDQFSPSFIKHETSPFTKSSPFTPSFTFSPNATKYPDGIFNNKPNIEGRNKQASPTAIGATAGISIVLIVVSVFLMILYIRNKRKQLQEKLDNLSDSFLCDSTVSDSSSYSYSYYSYDYTYTYVNDSQYSYSVNDDNHLEYQSYDDASYSDFNGTSVFFDDLSQE